MQKNTDRRLRVSIDFGDSWRTVQLPDIQTGQVIIFFTETYIFLLKLVLFMISHLTITNAVSCSNMPE